MEREYIQKGIYRGRTYIEKRYTRRRYIHGVRIDKEKEHIGKGHTGSGEIHEEWRHTWRIGIYGEGIHIE